MSSEAVNAAKAGAAGIGSVASSAGDGISSAASAAGDGIDEAASAVFEAADVVGEAGASAVAAAGAGLEDVASAAGDGLERVGTAAVDLGSNVSSSATAALSSFDSALDAGAAEFQNIAGLYKSDMLSAKDDIMRIGGMASETCSKIVPLLRLEIFRDFSQIISVVFANVYTEVFGFMEDARKWFGGIASTIAVNLSEAFRSETALLIGVILAIVCTVATVFMFIWMVTCSGVDRMKMNAVRTGHETVQFSEAAKANKWTVFFVNATIILATSLYLPLTQSALHIVFCYEKSFFLVYFEVESCSEAIGMQAIAYFVLIGFTLGLPIFLKNQIYAHMPTGSPVNPEWTNDIDGLRVKFDNRIYNELVENDVEQLANPFRDLYRGYEKEYAWWKVLVMVYKFALTLAITVLVASKQSDVVIAVVTFFFMLLMFVYTYHAQPFIEPLNDTMDESGRFTAILASIAGFVSIVAGPRTNIAEAVGIIVLLSGVVNTVVMVSIMCSGVVWFRKFVKNTFGIFTFYDSCKNLGDLTAHNVLNTWMCQREVKHRVWQSFWNGIITQKCGEDATKRLLRLQADAIDYGIHYIQDHWLVLSDKQIAANRLYIRQYLEGVDLFYDNPNATRDGHLDSKTNFGKMYVVPYPFHLVIVYDDCDDETFIQGPERVAKFIALQNEPNIKAKIMKRKTLRALASVGHADPANLIPWPFQRMESRTVADGTDSYTDSEGKRHTKTHYSTINILMTYTLCYVGIKVNTELSHSAGFEVGIHYKDGSGAARKPRTGEMHVEANTPTEMDLIHIGFADLYSFETLPKYNQFMAAASQKIDIGKALKALLQVDNDYRQNLITKFDGERKTLSNSFWYFVFNNPKIRRIDLEKYLMNTETNEYLREFPEVDKAGLDYLYKRMEVIDKDDSSRLWYIFWEDLYYQNSNMKFVKDYDLLFDPTKPSAMCYKTPPTKEKLVEWLHNIDMSPTRTKNYFSLDTIDLLYERLNNPNDFPKEYERKRVNYLDTIFGRGAPETADAALLPQASVIPTLASANNGDKVVPESMNPSDSDSFEMAEVFPSTIDPLI